ncbi:MFS general substrate transporter [Polychaeton citri CBS 116435]|uniref:MFS general substrate transporter n=1 Tax=Polychaeton citri CBS 116435 TaxID=1314669 RepID=A0A9P4Q6J2_9PEZI|nr:MFS general substrate transporter [Polychaeton citri CBS 116435]
MLKVESDIPLTQLEKVEYKGKDWILLKFVDDDKEDPFNWTPFRKGYITAILCLMTLFVGLATTAYSSGVNSMVKDLNSTTEIGQLGLFLFNFVCAVAPLFLAPFCELAGRYIIYVGAYFCFCLCFIGLALGKNMATILVMRALLGLFGCVGTILVGGTFSDMYRSHERAVPMALFTFVAIFGTVGAPIYAGFIDMTIGWRWIEGIQGLANIPLLVCTVLFLRETRGGVVLQKRAKAIRQELDCKDYWAEVDLASSSLKDMLHEASVKSIRMLVTEPVVFAFGIWIAFAWFLTFLFLSVIPITFAEKRGWNEGVSGLPYISLCIGTTIAFVFNFLQIRKYQTMEDRAREGRRGSMFDKFTSTGAPVPEVRLYGAMFGSVWLPIGLFIYSFTQYADLPWIAPTIALAPIAIGIFFIFEATYSYTSDCYGENAGSAIAGQGLMRNMFGAVSPLFGSQMFHNMGSQWAGLLLAMIAVLLTFIPFIFFRFGSKLRARSKMAPT